MKQTIEIDNTIRDAAIAAGYADALVTRYFQTSGYTELTINEHGAWFALAIKRASDDEFEVIGRRRSRAELLQLVKRPNGQPAR